MRLTEKQYQALLFARQYPGWHTIGRPCPEVRQLAAKGLVQINRYNQFTATGPDGSTRD
jgi:hypothetical protein